MSLHHWPPFSHVATSCWAEFTQWPELPKIIKKMKTLSFAQRPYKGLFWRWRNNSITRQTWKICEINRILSKIIENCLRKFEDIKKILWQSLHSDRSLHMYILVLWQNWQYSALLVSDLPAFRPSYRVTKAQKTKKKSIFFKKSQNEEIASKVKNSVY